MTEIADAAFILSIVVAITVIGTFILSWRSHEQENKKTYSEITTRISSDFLQFSDESKNISDIDSLAFWTQKYANYSEVLAHLLKNEKIDKDIGILFASCFHDAYNSAISMEKKFPKFEVAKFVPFLKEWCEKNPYDINPFPNLYVQIETKLKQKMI